MAISEIGKSEDKIRTANYLEARNTLLGLNPGNSSLLVSALSFSLGGSDGPLSYKPATVS